MKLSGFSHPRAPLTGVAVLLCLGVPGMAVGSRAPASVRGAHENPPVGVGLSDWSGIRSAYEEARHAVVATEIGHRARNALQGFETRFDERGFSVEADDRGWSFGLELVRYGWGEREECVGQPDRRSA